VTRAALVVAWPLPVATIVPPRLFRPTVFRPTVFRTTVFRPAMVVATSRAVGSRCLVRPVWTALTVRVTIAVAAVVAIPLAVRPAATGAAITSGGSVTVRRAAAATRLAFRFLQRRHRYAAGLAGTGHRGELR